MLFISVIPVACKTVVESSTTVPVVVLATDVVGFVLLDRHFEELFDVLIIVMSSQWGFSLSIS